MELINPSVGLIIWMLIGFGLLFFVLARYAWPVITKAITEREQYIENQLAEADKIRMEMKNLKSEHQLLLQQAKEERDAILADARKVRDKMYDDAKAKANNEAKAIIDSAKEAIHFEKMKAVTDIKNEIAIMSIEIAEKILREELSGKARQEQLIDKWMQDVRFN